jgi:hypothetical protein
MQTLHHRQRLILIAQPSKIFFQHRVYGSHSQQECMESVGIAIKLLSLNFGWKTCLDPWVLCLKNCGPEIMESNAFVFINDKVWILDLDICLAHSNINVIQIWYSMYDVYSYIYSSQLQGEVFVYASFLFILTKHYLYGYAVKTIQPTLMRQNLMLDCKQFYSLPKNE